MCVTACFLHCVCVDVCGVFGEYVELWNQWFVCYLEVFWFGVLSLLVFWSVIIDSVGLPLITLLQLTSESTGLYSVSVVKCWWLAE